MFEGHTAGLKVRGEMVRPLRQIVDENCATGFYHPNCLVYPSGATLRVVVFLLVASAVLFAQKPLRNQDVIDMAHKGMSNDAIGEAMMRNLLTLDVSAAGVTGLHAAGLEGQLIDMVIVAGARPQTEGSFAVIGSGIPLTGRAVHQVRVSGWIKSDHVLNGYAGLWVRVDGKDNKRGALDNSRDRYVGDQHDEPSVRGATGSTPWTEYHVDLPVADGATGIAYGALMPGQGTAWFDALQWNWTACLTPIQSGIKFENAVCRFQWKISVRCFRAVIVRPGILRQ